MDMHAYWHREEEKKLFRHAQWDAFGAVIVHCVCVFECVRVPYADFEACLLV